MTVNRMARRLAIALACELVVVASAFARQDALTHAKDLYASAAYEEALAVLDRLQLDPSLTDAAEVGQYRAFCLLALGRSDEGRRAIEAIVESNPLFLPSEQLTSPRLLAVFRDVRRQLLPRIVRDSYTSAKSAFDRKEMEAAAAGFDRVLLLLNDPDSTDSEGLTDIRMLATGFRDLSKLGLTAVPSAPAVSPSPPSAAAAPKPEAPPEVPEPRRTYGPEDTTVTAPVVVSQTRAVVSQPADTR
jgi:tetratricopeptide (TPR) repeat protein